MRREVMFWRITWATLLLLWSSTAFPGDGTIIDNFESSQVNHLPPSWRTWPFQRGKAATVYRVAEEKGNRFLRAVDRDGVSVQLLRSIDWDAEKFPLLSWRWRAHELPRGAAESNDALNDSACGVYITFGKFQGRALKYVWSSTLPAGEVVTRREGKLKITVLDTGAKKIGQWQTRTVDVIKDAQLLFGTLPEKNPSGIAILTDGNATHSPAACDYDDFILRSR